MKSENFTISIQVSQSPKQVFDAICQPQYWWSGEIEGSAMALNDEFTYRYKDLHMSRQKVIEFIPERRVVWLVTDSTIEYADDKQEWTGTRICFEILEDGDKTNLQFTHLGLHPQIECFESCSVSWTRLLQLSLFSLITTGKGEKLVLA